ncbi:hypothetical protein ACLOJK_038031 [Asimina triloba]
MGGGLSLVDHVFIPRWVVDRSVMSYVGEPSHWPDPSRRGASKNPKYADALNRRLDEQVVEHTRFRNEVRQQLQEMRELLEDYEEFPREDRRREQVVESRLSLQAPSQVRHHLARQDVAQDRKDAAAFHKLNPPKFSGGTSEMADNWIAAMRKAFKHLGCTDD